MRSFYVIALVAALAPIGAQASNPTSIAAAASYSAAATDLGTLLDNPMTRAVLEKYIPRLVENEQVAMARGMTLRAIQPMAGEMLSNEVLSKIDAELAKIPVK